MRLISIITLLLLSIGLKAQNTISPVQLFFHTNAIQCFNNRTSSDVSSSDTANTITLISTSITYSNPKFGSTNTVLTIYGNPEISGTPSTTYIVYKITYSKGSMTLLMSKWNGYMTDGKRYNGWIQVTRNSLLIEDTEDKHTVLYFDKKFY